MSLMVSYFVLYFLPQDVLDEIWDRTGSVPETFPTNSYTTVSTMKNGSRNPFISPENITMMDLVLLY